MPSHFVVNRMYCHFFKQLAQSKVVIFDTASRMAVNAHSFWTTVVVAAKHSVSYYRYENARKADEEDSQIARIAALVKAHLKPTAKKTAELTFDWDIAAAVNKFLPEGGDPHGIVSFVQSLEEELFGLPGSPPFWNREFVLGGASSGVKIMTPKRHEAAEADRGHQKKKQRVSGFVAKTQGGKQFIEYEDGTREDDATVRVLPRAGKGSPLILNKVSGDMVMAMRNTDNHGEYLASSGLGGFVGLGWLAEDIKYSEVAEFIRNFEKSTSKTKVDGIATEITEELIIEAFHLPSAGSKVAIRAARFTSALFPSGAKRNNGYLLKDCDSPRALERLKFFRALLYLQVDKPEIASAVVKAIEHPEPNVDWGHFFGKRLIEEFGYAADMAAIEGCINVLPHARILIQFIKDTCTAFKHAGKRKGGVVPTCLQSSSPAGGLERGGVEQSCRTTSERSPCTRSKPGSDRQDGSGVSDMEEWGGVDVREQQFQVALKLNEDTEDEEEDDLGQPSEVTVITTNGVVDVRGGEAGNGNGAVGDLSIWLPGHNLSSDGSNIAQELGTALSIAVGQQVIAMCKSLICGPLEVERERTSVSLAKSKGELRKKSEELTATAKLVEQLRLEKQGLESSLEVETGLKEDQTKLLQTKDARIRELEGEVADSTAALALETERFNKSVDENAKLREESKKASDEMKQLENSKAMLSEEMKQLRDENEKDSNRSKKELEDIKAEKAESDAAAEAAERLNDHLNRKIPLMEARLKKLSGEQG